MPNPNFTREYTFFDSITPLTIRAHPKACFFCDHCTDIYWDYSHGPYAFVCEKHSCLDDAWDEILTNGLSGICPEFEETK